MADWTDLVRQQQAGNITQGDIANVVRSGNLTRADTTSLKNWQLRYVGKYEYTQLYPEIYDPSYKPVDYDPAKAAFTLLKCARLAEADKVRAEIADLAGLAGQFRGATGTYIRWLINNEIKQKAIEIEQIFERETNVSMLREQLAKSREVPMPEWLGQYLEPSIPFQKPRYPYTEGMETIETEKKRRGWLKPEDTPSLIPLGAQAKLNIGQLGLMAGYQSWGKAGAPRRFSQGAIAEMADWQGDWDAYTRLSQSLFPAKVKLAPRWLTASQ